VTDPTDRADCTWLLYAAGLLAFAGAALFVMAIILGGR